jgi:nucleotide-binding universal stress UspA family protein
MAFELGTDGPSVIVVGMDGSETSMRAGAYAAGLARRQGSRVIVVYVMNNAPMLDPSGMTVQPVRSAQEEIGDELRKEFQESVARLNIRGEFVTVAGNPYVELTRIAKERRADAIVVGASAKAGHRFVGSLAVHLVRDAKWPVTVVP